MAKYNITEKGDDVARYSTMLSTSLMENLRKRILEIIVLNQKYKDKDYSAGQLALDIGTNTRYISAVMSIQFHTSYNSFVNQLRINDAKALLMDKRYANLTIEEVGDIVGYSNRQSFYASFYKFTGTTPKQYRSEHLRK